MKLKISQKKKQPKQTTTDFFLANIATNPAGYADLGTAFQANIDAETARQRKDLEQQQEKTPPETVTPPAPATQEATGIEALRKENAELKAKIAALEAVRWQRPTGETDDGSSPRMNQLLAPPDIRVEAISRPGTAAPEHKATSTERDEELARWAALVRLRDQQIKEKSEKARRSTQWSTLTSPSHSGSLRPADARGRGTPFADAGNETGGKERRGAARRGSSGRQPERSEDGDVGTNPVTDDCEDHFSKHFAAPLTRPHPSAKTSQAAREHVSNRVATARDRHSDWKRASNPGKESRPGSGAIDPGPRGLRGSRGEEIETHAKESGDDRPR